MISFVLFSWPGSEVRIFHVNNKWPIVCFLFSMQVHVSSTTKQMQKCRKGVDAKLCDVFVTDWSNLIFHIHDHADPRCCLSVREVPGRGKT